MASKRTKAGSEGAMLSEDQLTATYQTIVLFFKEYGVSPTVEQIASRMDLGSQQVRTRLQALVNEGSVIRRQNGRIALTGGLFLTHDEVDLISEYVDLEEVQLFPA